MDTALFYPSYLDLSPAEAQTTLEAMIATTYRYGGCLTTSCTIEGIAPERQWGEPTDISYGTQRASCVVCHRRRYCKVVCETPSGDLREGSQ